MVTLKVRVDKIAEPQEKKIRKRKLPELPGRRLKMSYPYDTSSREEHQIVLEINDLVPKGLDPELRADICQDIIVAVLDGSITVRELQSRNEFIRSFIKRAYGKNFEDDGDAVSFSLGDDCSDDEMASKIAAKEWAANQRYEDTKAAVAFKFFEPPTQIEDVYRSQIWQLQKKSAATGMPLSFEEVEEQLTATI